MHRIQQNYAVNEVCCDIGVSNILSLIDDNNNNNSFFISLNRVIKANFFACCWLPVYSVFSRQDSRTLPQPIKHGIIRPDWVKKIWNQAKTPQLELSLAATQWTEENKLYIKMLVLARQIRKIFVKFWRKNVHVF